MAQPQSLQFDLLAEQAILSNLLTNPKIIEDLTDYIVADDFYENRNSIIYQTITDLHLEGRSFDPTTLLGELKIKGKYAAVGGVEYITEILTPTNLNQYIGDPIGYANIVRDLAVRRKLIELSALVDKAARIDSGVTSEDAIALAEEGVLRIAQDEKIGQPIAARDLIEETQQLIEEAALVPEGAVAGIPTGLPMLDEMTNGFNGGQIIILAARPSVGKSALALDFSRAAAFLANKSVLFFSLEMGYHELMSRLISSQGLIELANLKRGRLSKEESMRYQTTLEQIRKSNLIFDSPTKQVDFNHVRSRAIRQKYSPEGLDMIVIDYIGLMQVRSENKNYNKVNEIGLLSGWLKLLARELEIPIIVLSQLNRNPDSRGDKRPAISDLRESGSLEQDADIVLLIHRPEQQDPDIRPGEADLIVGKNRNGPTGIIPLVPMLEFAKYAQGDGDIPPDNSVYENNENLTPPTAAEDTPW